MATYDPTMLNATFDLGRQLRFHTGRGQLTFAAIENEHARATIALQGAQILTFQPRGQQSVLWLSKRSNYSEGQPIRGGIPVCWPWFGPHPTDPAQPQHGFVRTAPWDVTETGATANGTQVRLHLRDHAEHRQRWPHHFELELIVTVGAALTVDLIARNTGDAPFTCSGALHSYFAVGDVGSITIDGLDQTGFIDKVDRGTVKQQIGAIVIDREVDRVYQATTARCTINDPGLGRRIVVDKAGSHTTVVWNPWIDKTLHISDMGHEDYRQMVCVETANAGDNVITIVPGGEHRLRVIIGVEEVAQ